MSDHSIQPKYGAPDWPPSNVVTTIYQPFSITSFALALLMVFRTNSSYARLAGSTLQCHSSAPSKLTKLPDIHACHASAHPPLGEGLDGGFWPNYRIMWLAESMQVVGSPDNMGSDTQCQQESRPAGKAASAMPSALLSPLQFALCSIFLVRSGVQPPGLECNGYHRRQQRSQVQIRRRRFRLCVGGVQRWAIS